MHDKEKLATYIDITKSTIRICWFALFSFWAIKRFGGNFFEILVENENFIKFSQLVQYTWLKYLVSLFTISLSNYLFLGAILQKFTFNGKYSIIYMVSVFTMWIVANFIDIEIVKMLYGYIVFILIGIIYQKSWKKTFGLFAVFFELTFTIISMITRNINVNVMSDYFITSILIIDVYLMSALYFLYSNLIRIKKEK